ncbi:MAG: MFS transporter [Treponema sp.]|jgi:MFS family permease|nr:MFS transporter [Treponema sp.]
MNNASVSEQGKVIVGADAKSNFGLNGWNLIIFCGLMLFYATGTSVDGLNATVQGLSILHGWDVATLLGFSTVSGLVSILGMFIFGLICARIGARWTSIIGLVLGGASYIWYGNVRSIPEYAVALCMVSVFANVYAWIGGGAYMASWFPKKKGLALGWATMGNNFASAVIVIILTGFASLFGGIQRSISVVGIIMILSAVWGWFIPDRPEQAGATPDNVPMDNEEIEAYRARSNTYVSPWTYKKLLGTKQFWLISLGLGLYMLVTVGVMSQLVPRLVSLGFELNWAIGSMTVCALVGVVGSYLWGVLDQKFTTRIATAIYGIWYALAVVFNLIPNRICVYISIVMIGIAIGGNANWPASLVSTTFGYRNFSKVYSLINPSISIIRMCAFVTLAAAISLTGSMTGAYILFVGLAVLAAVLIFFVNDKQYAEQTDTAQ